MGQVGATLMGKGVGRPEVESLGASGPMVSAVGLSENPVLAPQQPGRFAVTVEAPVPGGNGFRPGVAIVGQHYHLARPDWARPNSRGPAPSMRVFCPITRQPPTSKMALAGRAAMTPISRPSSPAFSVVGVLFPSVPGQL